MEEIGSQSGLEPRLGTPEARDACEICMGTATVAVVGWLDSVRSLLLTVVLWVSPTLFCFIDLFMPWPLDNVSPHTSLTK